MRDRSSEYVGVVLASVAVPVHEGRGGRRIVGCSSAGEVGRGREGWLAVGVGKVRKLTDIGEGGRVRDGTSGVVVVVREGVIGLSVRGSRRRREVSKRFGRRGSGSDFSRAVEGRRSGRERSIGRWSGG